MIKQRRTVTHMFLDDIMGTTPLSKQDEQDLFQLYLKGSEEARTKLLSSNLRFVLKVAQQYRMAPVPLSDLVAEGALGLIRAIETFDPSRGLRFISYAVWWIKVYINRQINETSSLIRLPAHKNIMVRKAMKERARGQKLKAEVEQLVDMCERGVVSLDARVSENSGTSFGDLLLDSKSAQPDEIALRQTAQDFIRKVLSELPEREAIILKGLYGIDFGSPETLEEMSVNLNLSKERIRQLRDRALQKLKKSKYKDILRENFEAYKDAAA